MDVILSLSLLTVICFILCSSMKAIPERITIDYQNEKYVSNVTGNVRRYGRKSGYYVNIEGTTLTIFGNNVTFDIILYEYLHNEYRRSFVEFHAEHLCDFLNKDPYVGKAVMVVFEKLKITCPIPPQLLILANMSLPMEAFPYVWPFERAKGVGTLSCNHRKTIIAVGSLYLRFEQKAKKKTKRSIKNQMTIEN